MKKHMEISIKIDNKGQFSLIVEMTLGTASKFANGHQNIYEVMKGDLKDLIKIIDLVKTEHD